MLTLQEVAQELAMAESEVIQQGSENNVIESNLPQENAEAALRYILKFIETQFANRATSD